MFWQFYNFRKLVLEKFFLVFYANCVLFVIESDMLNASKLICSIIEFIHKHAKMQCSEIILKFSIFLIFFHENKWALFSSCIRNNEKCHDLWSEIYDCFRGRFLQKVKLVNILLKIFQFAISKGKLSFRLLSIELLIAWQFLFRHYRQKLFSVILFYILVK